jgi:hypothetical protein
MRRFGKVGHCGPSLPKERHVMSKLLLADIEQCGRLITTKEIEEIIATVEAFPNLRLSTLTETICEHLEWFTATGRYKRDACLKLLQRLEIQGVIKLPEKRKHSHYRIAKTEHNICRQVAEANHIEIHGGLHDIEPVRVKPVTDKSEIKLWNEYIERYHYLGYKRPFGCCIRYTAQLVKGGIIACVMFSGAAKALRLRDQWIGWNDSQRLKNLPWVINNSRFAIMPWVKIPCLASHILGKINRRIVKDWQQQWGYKPLLMETFVDPLRYRGTCYKAANWQCIGRTTGEGFVRKGKSYTTTPKLIFTRPLAKKFRRQLCSEYLEGRVEDE